MPFIEIDASDALRVAADLAASVAGLDLGVRKAVATGAEAIKKGMRADMAASAHFGQVASSITYDLSGGGSFSEAQIGPTRGSPGSLANIAYFGGANGGGGTVADPMESAEAALPEIEAALDALVAALL